MSDPKETGTKSSELIFYNEEGEVEGIKNNDMLWYTFEVFKRQQSRIVMQQSRINILKAKVNILMYDNNLEN